MRKLAVFFVVMGIGCAAPQNMPFTGTWRVNFNKTEMPKKPQEIELAGGVYRCFTCDPKIEVKADGQDHAVKTPGMDTLNVRIVDERTVETTGKKGGKVVSTGKVTVSSDGKHAVAEFVQHPPNSSEPVKGKVELARAGAPKADAHISSGSWSMAKVGEVSENGRVFTYEETGDGLKYTDPMGSSSSAKFDGKDYPMNGDPTTDAIALKKIDARTVEATTKYQGKVTGTQRMTISPDGKTMTIEWRDPNGFSGKVIAEKQ